jgi:hypothetical protein
VLSVTSPWVDLPVIRARIESLRSRAPDSGEALALELKPLTKSQPREDSGAVR